MGIRSEHMPCRRRLLAGDIDFRLLSRCADVSLKDLVSWEHVGNVLDRESQLASLPGLSIDKGGIYAPALTYNPHNKTFYMITTCVMKGNGRDGSSENFYVTAKNPLGPWSDPVILEDVDGIDPSFFLTRTARDILYTSQRSTVPLNGAITVPSP